MPKAPKRRTGKEVYKLLESLGYTTQAARADAVAMSQPGWFKIESQPDEHVSRQVDRIADLLEELHAKGKLGRT